MLGVERRNRGGVRVLENLHNRPLTRVELHVHLDGAIRHETLYELAKEKKLVLPGKGSFEELVEYMVVKKPGDLASFLSRFHIILDSLKGDLEAIERLAYEFVEDSANQGILYGEARFCPHILTPLHSKSKEIEGGEERKKWVWNVTGALIKGLQKGRSEFKAHVKLIATCIRGYPHFWYEDTMDLLLDVDFHGGWVVGVDIAALPDTSCETLMVEKDAVDLFQKATKHGIHRTVHAGESGGASQVTTAIDMLHAERIGHGYRIVEDPAVYERVRREQVHLECCPWSSLLTGGVPLTQHPHPVVQFFQDEFNVSINTDDPTITGTRLDDEYSLLTQWGLSEVYFVRGNFNAARSCFLPEAEKKDLLQTLSKNYGAHINC